MSQDYLVKFRKYFQSNRHNCPECGAELGKAARICPECGHNFMVPEEERPQMVKFNYNAEACCSIILLLLIIAAFFFYLYPEFRKILFVIAAIIAVFGIAVALFFAHIFVKLRRIFRF